MIEDMTEQSERDESALIAAAKEDPREFGKLYERYVDRIYNYIYQRVSGVRDAEDLTSRTFYRALSHLPDYEDRGYPFSAWLYRIAHNLLANWYRDHDRHEVLALNEDIAENPVRNRPEVQASVQSDKELLATVVQELDRARQELLVLKFTEGLTNRQIGKIMGRSEGAIKSLYHRTLLQLRDEMAKKGLEIECD